MSEFSPVHFDDMDTYLNLLEKCPQHTADYTFLNLWSWAEFYGLEWSFNAGLCWIRQTRPAIQLWAPIGAWEDILFWNELPPMQLHRVPERLKELFQQHIPQRVQCTENPDHAEYIYDTAIMGSLRGNRMHRKKNHVNSYIKAYGEEYRPISPASFASLQAVNAAWTEQKETEENANLLAGEQSALSRVLAAWEQFPTLTGGSLYAGDTMVAFCLGEPLDNRTMLVHFEKARTEYQGAYQAINYFFSKAHAERYPLLNREQDLGEPGLRKAKQSYYPVGFLLKYTVEIA